MESEPVAHAMKQRADDPLGRSVFATNAAHVPGTALARKTVFALTPSPSAI